MKEITALDAGFIPAPQGRTGNLAERWGRLKQLPGLVKEWGRPLLGRVSSWVEQERPYWKAGLRSFVQHLHLALTRTYSRREAALALAAATVLGLVLCLCLVPIPYKAETYLLVEGTQTYAIHDRPDFAYEGRGLDVVDTETGRDAQVLLEPDQTVTVTAAGQVHTITTRRETVANLLRRLGLSAGEGEMIVVEMGQTGPAIQICSDYTATHYEDVRTDFETIRRPNHRLAKGTEQVVQEGQQGTVTNTYSDTYEMGELVATQLVGSTEDNSVPQIVEYGTLVTSVASGDTIQSVEYDGDGSGLLIFASGDSMLFDAKVTCSATAYSGGWGTASGMSLGAGTVAVDTSVFPFGTRFFIQTTSGSWVYGMGTAKDRGSSIKGNKIDLWFDSYSTACNWGRRDVTVYVLD